MADFDALIAVNRLGLGARPGDLAAISSNPRDWLHEQIRPSSALPPAIRQLDGSAQILRNYQDDRNRQPEQMTNPDDVNLAQRQEANQNLRNRYSEQLGARVSSAMTTTQPFRERLVHFWSNHFAVSVDKRPVDGIAGCLENEAVRPNVCGFFADLLLAIETHPAMILYLDNQRSVGPNSPQANPIRRRRSSRAAPARLMGLNENLGREILELHTLGVDGGYGQDDVIELARALTGWSVDGMNNAATATDDTGTFTFNTRAHEPGGRQLLGVDYPETGFAQAVSILKDLAIHPATAYFVSGKIAAHLVGDETACGAGRTHGSSMAGQWRIPARCLRSSDQ